MLIVEDNAADVFLIREAVRRAELLADLHIARDGERAIWFFDEADADINAPCPAVVLLDINLPKQSGSQVLQHLRKSRRCGKALVIAVSSSDLGTDREEMTRLGADGYFHKPSEYEEFMKLGNIIKDLLST
jgi:chemotaxis family two-component system response regulator Rcp1